MVEHAAVNRRVVGSSPTGGATSEQSSLCSDFVFQEKKRRIFDFLGNDMPPFLINVDLHLCARLAVLRASEKIAVSGYKENKRRSIKIDFAAHGRELKTAFPCAAL